MSTKRPHHPNDRDRDRDRGYEHGEEEGGKFEHDEGNASPIEIEERRSRGGLPPTPELYDRAREQWNQLPGAVVKSPMDQKTPANPPAEPEPKPGESNEDENQQEKS